MTHLDSPAERIARCRAGDSDAIEWFVRAHQAAIFRLALSILDDSDEADEATQETLLAALRRLDRYRGDAALTTWLYAIAVNVCRGRLRRHQSRQRLRRMLEMAGLVAGAAPEAGVPDSPPPPEAAAIQRESAERVWSAVQALGEKHRLPIILRYYHDLPIAEIAQVLSLSEGTVHSRLSIARDRLRDKLKPNPAPQPEAKPL